MNTYYHSLKKMSIYINEDSALYGHDLGHMGGIFEAQGAMVTPTPTHVRKKALELQDPAFRAE